MGTIRLVALAAFALVTVVPDSHAVLYWGRAYDGNLQRWLQRDPIGERGGVNLYQFVGSNPLSYIDPDGMAPQLTSLSFNIGGGGASAQYSDQQFGQGYGIGLNGPLGPGGGIALMMGATMVPGVGEAMDLSVLADPNSRWWELGLSGASLGLSMMTDGLTPNAGGFLKGGKAACQSAGKGLPAVSKAVNSELAHAAERAAERGVFAGKQEAADALRALSEKITQSGFPAGTLADTARADRVLVPIGNNGMAVYQVGKNGTAKLKTVLLAH